MTRLADVAAVSGETAATGARSAKTARLAELLRAADRSDVPALVAWLSGELLQRRVGVGWASLARMPASAATPSLTVEEVNRAFGEMASAAGAGSQGRRAALLLDVMSRATEVEQSFLRALLAGNLRQGALAGVMLDAVAKAAGVPVATVRRATMLRGDLPAVAAAAMEGGAPALASFRLEVGCALAPMLAQTAGSVAEALSDLGAPAAFEAKLDGARIQIHKHGEEVRLFTRSLDDVTARLARVAAEVARWPAPSLVVDGEILWFAFAGKDAPERPLPFQETASRFASGAGEERPSIFLFDALHVDGVDLLDLPNAERRAALERLETSARLVDRVVTSDAAEAEAFLDRMLARGYEGVVAKSLSAPYEAGRRGASWRKIKPVLTLDLVVLAVEWGSGRRTGKLSNIHLGARDPATGGFVMLGKTFKGMTDAMLAWQTERFLALTDGPTDGYVVKLRPEQVVEIAFDGLQTSTRYPGGMALRFARVLRYREDKTAAEADTIETVRAIHARRRGE
ncbi:MAG: ATP-dependent DNA ligase [Labilithrix sp.]|nr:ATP-dependent DNA ligase [Labilithrix sp.]MCW5815749.1 ATP-dependent DNA ligase [Labilithrix sp.]